MHDIAAIREDAAKFAAGLRRRGIPNAQAVVDEIVAMDSQLRAIKTTLQQSQARRNEVSKQIGAAKARKDEVAAEGLMREVAGLKDAIQEGEENERVLGAKVSDLLAALPNIPSADVPDGPDEEHNVEVKAASPGLFIYPLQRCNIEPLSLMIVLVIKPRTSCPLILTICLK